MRLGSTRSAGGPSARTRRPRGATRVLAPLVGGVLALALAACGTDRGSSDDSSAGSGVTTGVASASGAPSAPVSSTPPASPSTSPSASPTGSASAGGSRSPGASASGGSGGARVPGCTSADLSFSLGSPQGAAGSSYYPLRMTNTSSRACRTGGYGGVSLVGGGNGSQVGAAATRNARGKVVAIVLKPGAHATATLQVAQALNVPRARCRPQRVDGLRVYAPNETASQFVKVGGLLGCRSKAVHLLSLTPYQPVA